MTSPLPVSVIVPWISTISSFENVRTLPIVVLMMTLLSSVKENGP